MNEFSVLIAKPTNTPTETRSLIIELDRRPKSVFEVVGHPLHQEGGALVLSDEHLLINLLG